MKLFIAFLLISINNFAMQEFKQPQWDEHLNFEEIEKQLSTYKIVKLIDMRTYLKEQNKKAFFSKEVYLAVLENGLKAVFKPERELYLGYGEVAAYRASKRVNGRLVPPTILTQYKGRRGSLQFYVESPFDLLSIKDYEKAFGFLAAKTISDMFLFYFIFGQFDNHGGNQIIAYDGNKATLALIDNASIILWSKTQYGHHSFVKILQYEDENIAGDFPYDKTFKIPLPIDEVNLTAESMTCTNDDDIIQDVFPIYQMIEKGEEFRGKPYGIPISLIDYFNSLKGSYLPTIIWKNMLWLQLYYFDSYPLKLTGARINATSVYSKQTLEHYKKLTLEDLNYIFEDAIKDKCPACTTEFLREILLRRDHILNIESKELID